MKINQVELHEFADPRCLKGEEPVDNDLGTMLLFKFDGSSEGVVDLILQDTLFDDLAGFVLGRSD